MRYLVKVELIDGNFIHLIPEFSQTICSWWKSGRSFDFSFFFVSHSLIDSCQMVTNNCKDDVSKFVWKPFKSPLSLRKWKCFGEASLFNLHHLFFNYQLLAQKCSVYGRSCRIYSPKSFGFFRKEFRSVRKINKYIIYRLRGGTYGEKLWLRSWKCCPRQLPRAAFSRPRSQFFISASSVSWIISSSSSKAFMILLSITDISSALLCPTSVFDMLNRVSAPVPEIFRWYLIRPTKFIINQTELYNEGEVTSYSVIVTYHKWLTGV